MLQQIPSREPAVLMSMLGTKCRQSGFLQVRENWEKSGNFSGQGKVGGKYFCKFVKVMEDEKLVAPDVRFSG